MRIIAGPCQHESVLESFEIASHCMFLLKHWPKNAPKANLLLMSLPCREIHVQGGGVPPTLRVVGFDPLKAPTTFQVNA